MKKCPKCGIDKPLTAEYYHRNSSRPSGFRSQCKVCKSKQHAEYYQNNKEKIAKTKAEYRQNNKERALKYAAEYRIQKKTEQPACVYQIVNSVNNKIYIGETTRGELRWNEHLKSLRGNYHTNPKLQADFDKFGEEVFKWSIIEEYPKDKNTLQWEEIKAIDKLLREGKELYNLSLTIDQLKLLTENK
tara:strand:+ start:274 stop:837 length:564 start_codon:yes stop_codon:yes gene_type:complete